MRAIFVLNELIYSGAERMLLGAADQWRVNGIEPAILTIGMEEGVFADRLRAAGYVIHHLPFVRAPSFVFRLLLFFRAHRFDVVHVHCERAGVWLLATAWLAGCRSLVRTAHSPRNFRGGLRLSRMAERWLARRLLGVRFVAVSETVRASEAACFANPCRVIGNWIDLSAFPVPSAADRLAARARLGLPADGFVLASVGNCSPVKNHEAVLRALPELPEALYLHAGYSSDEAGERALAVRLGVEDRVRFLGVVDDVAEVLAAADCFVMPSLYEGQGMAAAEALASGLPCVLSDVAGLRDLRGFGAAVDWCTPLPDSVAAALRRLAALSPAERRARAEAAAGQARRMFAMPPRLRDYVALYRRSADNSRHSAT